MRCFGLTIERRRCAADALDAAGYCAEHRRDARDQHIKQDPVSIIARIATDDRAAVVRHACAEALTELRRRA